MIYSITEALHKNLIFKGGLLLMVLKITFFKVSERNLFVMKIVLLNLFFFSIFYAFREKFSILLILTASILSFFLNLLGIPNSVQNEVISFPNATFEIIYECTALFPFIIFSSAVLSYPSSLKKKFLGVSAGAAIIYSLNILRLIVLSLIGIHYPSVFRLVHSFLWESLFLLLVILIFFYWVNWNEKRE